tara:strand:- start:763 stop:1023 length:261 start_codon:yes stop_codon:yes gene_type:complete
MKKFSNLFEYSLRCANVRNCRDHVIIYSFITEELNSKTIPITEYVSLSPCKKLRMQNKSIPEAYFKTVQDEEYINKIIINYNNIKL